MKKSNLFLLAAVIILFVSLAIYNSNLRAEYLTGTYKDPYRNFDNLTFKNFTTVAVNAASEIGVTIQQGPDFKVQVFKPDADKIKISQQGDKLVIDVNYQQDQRYMGPQEKVVVTLPVLQAVTTNAQYTVAGKMITLGPSKDFSMYNLTKIIGFKQDSLFIQQDKLNRIELISNKLNFLHAITGTSAGSRSQLQINPDNTITQANLDIRNKAELSLTDILIPQLTYTFSDSARVNLSGSALAILKK